MKAFVTAILIAAPAMASAQSMNANEFHRRAVALEKKGALALLSRGEMNALMGEAKASAGKARDQRRADLAAGRKPRFCPADGKGALSSDDFVKRLGAIPATERAKINMTEATTRILAAKYPCAR